MIAPAVFAQIPGGTLDPLSVPKYQTPLLIPPVMPTADTITAPGGKPIDYYEISVRQFLQQILPAGLPATTVWGYGAVNSESKRGLLLHNAPSLTIEAMWNRPVRIKWINDLVADPIACATSQNPSTDPACNFLPHLLPVDPTLHWANPPGGNAGRDMRPDFTGKTYFPLADFNDPDTQYTQYTGPVPIVTHVHGSAGVGDESDGYAEAWYLPAANDIPAGYATKGTWYDFFANKANSKFGVTWGPGFATFQYPNSQRAGTIWYHDHSLGMTRLNVYAGPAGFYIVRGGPDGDKAVLDSRFGTPAVLPGPAPKANDMFPPNKTYYEIPIAIQDRSFNDDGSLFYPDSRLFFGPLDPIDPENPPADQFVPFTDISPIWNPEFFGNMIMVNGNTWPFQTVERRRYRFRFLNGSQSRFLILDFNNIPGVEVWQIANEGGFLAAPVNLTALGNQLLMGLAERADLIVDFTNVALGNYVLRNVGPDEPFGGGVPFLGCLTDPNAPANCFEPSDPNTTGQIMQFRVIPAVAPDPTTPPQFLTLPAITPLPAPSVTRHLALLEEMSMDFVDTPASARLGILDGDPNVGPATWMMKMWMDSITENPAVGATEVWELYNGTADAHPMHVHELLFKVLNRQNIFVDETNMTFEVDTNSASTGPEPWENGWKDTVIAYPGQVTRLQMKFAQSGLFVWHCHIVEHEDNEMMRPYFIGTPTQDYLDNGLQIAP